MRSAERVLIRAMTIIVPLRLKGFESCQCKILVFALCEFFPVICFFVTLLDFVFKELEKQV